MTRTQALARSGRISRRRDAGEKAGETLASMPRGSHCRVEAVAEADPGLAARMWRLGFAPGTDVEVVRRAPLGDPVVYRVGGAEICLRTHLAGQIRVVAAE